MEVNRDITIGVAGNQSNSINAVALSDIKNVCKCIAGVKVKPAQPKSVNKDFKERIGILEFIVAVLGSKAVVKLSEALVSYVEQEKISIQFENEKGEKLLLETSGKKTDKTIKNLEKFLKGR